MKRDNRYKYVDLDMFLYENYHSSLEIYFCMKKDSHKNDNERQ